PAESLSPVANKFSQRDGAPPSRSVPPPFPEPSPAPPIPPPPVLSPPPAFRRAATRASGSEEGEREEGVCLIGAGAMAENRKFVMPGQPPDFSHMLQDAQKRWLRPTEICEILSNYKLFSIAAEPPSRPPSGSLFLFDRKVLRYFRKDGHNWRKKKDGKTVKEAHEKLKSGSIDVLHCYYAHGEENENFQRRTYWLLEEDFTHIVLVHYLEVK
ncbi:unnamed protein product, partial [Urochloa humidicola]